MNESQTPPDVLNGYDTKAGLRTALGVLASLLIMGLPVGLAELLRAGGDLKVALWAFAATAVAVVLGALSIAGTKE